MFADDASSHDDDAFTTLSPQHIGHPAFIGALSFLL